MLETNVKGTINNEIKEAETMGETINNAVKEATAMDETAMKVVNVTEVKESMASKVENENVEIFNQNLPEITGQERNVIIANANEKYAINMQLLRNGGSMRSTGVVIFLSDIGTGEAFIDDSNELIMKKEKIVNGNVKVMDVLDQFSVAITPDTKKVAFERAQEYLKITSMATEFSTSMKIGEACREIVKYAIEQAKEEDRMAELVKAEQEEEPKKGSMKIEERKFFYIESEKRVGIRADYFQKVLDLLATGYKQGTFGKKVLVEEARTGKEILIRNRTGSGYGFNMTGNIRCYMFNIESILG